MESELLEIAKTIAGLTFHQRADLLDFFVRKHWHDNKQNEKDAQVLEQLKRWLIQCSQKMKRLELDLIINQIGVFENEPSNKQQR